MSPEAMAPPPVPTEEPPLYAVLGVTRTASDEEIRRAYKRQREIYATGGLATVSLLGVEQLGAAQRKLDEAYDTLLDAVMKALPEGPRYFPKDQITDQPERFLVAELIREQVLLATEQEVPYATTVLIEQYEEGARLTRVAAAIYCERDGQKAILIGKQGANLKKIGTAARLQIQSLLNTKVFLELFVKVRAGWRDSRDFVQETDWRTQLERMSSAAPDQGPDPDVEK